MIKQTTSISTVFNVNFSFISGLNVKCIPFGIE